MSVPESITEDEDISALLPRIASGDPLPRLQNQDLFPRLQSMDDVDVDFTE